MEVVKHETRFLMGWMFLLDAVLFLGSLAFQAFGLPMLLGILLGTGCALLNFWLLGYWLQSAMAKPPRSAQRQMALSYFGRYLMMGVVIFVGVRFPIFHGVGVIVPLFFPWLIYTGQAIFEQLKKRKAEERERGADRAIFSERRG